MAGPLAAAPDGVWLAVRVSPRSRRPGIGGVGSDGALAVAVSAAPEDGKATQAAVELLAAHFGLPRRAFTLTQGAAARRKRFRVEGPPASLLAAMRAKLP